MTDEKIGLGDIVGFVWEDGYNDGTVCQVHADGTIDIFRVYVHTGGIAMAGRREGSLSVITYIGTETIRDIDPSRARLKLLRKAAPPR